MIPDIEAPQPAYEWVRPADSTPVFADGVVTVNETLMFGRVVSGTPLLDLDQHGALDRVRAEAALRRVLRSSEGTISEQAVASTFDALAAVWQAGAMPTRIAVSEEGDGVIHFRRNGSFGSVIADSSGSLALLLGKSRKVALPASADELRTLIVSFDP